MKRFTQFLLEEPSRPSTTADPSKSSSVGQITPRQALYNRYGKEKAEQIIKSIREREQNLGPDSPEMMAVRREFAIPNYSDENLDKPVDITANKGFEGSNQAAGFANIQKREIVLNTSTKDAMADTLPAVSEVMNSQTGTPSADADKKRRETVLNPLFKTVTLGSFEDTYGVAFDPKNPKHGQMIKALHYQNDPKSASKDYTGPTVQGWKDVMDVKPENIKTGGEKTTRPEGAKATPTVDFQGKTYDILGHELTHILQNLWGSPDNDPMSQPNSQRKWNPSAGLPKEEAERKAYTQDVYEPAARMSELKHHYFKVTNKILPANMSAEELKDFLYWYDTTQKGQNKNFDDTVDVIRSKEGEELFRRVAKGQKEPERLSPTAGGETVMA